MKKFIFLFFSCCSNYFLNAQYYDLPSKDLNGKFVDIYRQTDKKKNLFERLTETNDFFFSPFNEPVVKTVVGLQKRYKLSLDSAANLIFDSVMVSFARHHLWDEYTGDIEKYIPFFELYNGKLCPCFGEKITQSEFHRLEEKGMSECIQKLITDSSYINGIRRVMGSSTMNEIYDAAKMGLPYMYQHCTTLYEYYSNLIRYSVYTFVGELNNGITNFDQTVLQLYKNKSPELANAFPAYKKFETDLQSANDLFSQKGASYIFDKTKDASGHLTVIKTYYGHKDEKLIIFGQIVFILKEEVEGSPVLSFKFTTADKMKDKEKYLVKIGDEDILEPPPFNNSKKIDIMIDTMQKKN